jgi:hypothetical protein
MTTSLKSLPPRPPLSFSRLIRRHVTSAIKTVFLNNMRISFAKMLFGMVVDRPVFVLEQ